MTRRRTASVAASLALLAAASACGSHGARPSTTPTPGRSPSASTSAPTSAGTCPTDLTHLTEVASLATGDGSVPPALAFGGSTLYAVTATGSAHGARVTVLDLSSRRASDPADLDGAGATEALGAGDRGAVVLSDATTGHGLVASFVGPDGAVAWQVPLPDETAGGSVRYGAEVVGDTVYLGTAAGTVTTLGVQDGKPTPPASLPAGLVPRNVLLAGTPYLTMVSAVDASAAAQTVEVVDPATGDTLGSYAGPFFTDADGNPVAVRNDLLVEVTPGASITVLGSAKGFGTDVVAAAFCRKYVYSLSSQGQLELVDLGKGSTLTTATLSGLRADQSTVVAVPAGLVVLGTSADDPGSVDIRLATSG